MKVYLFSSWFWGLNVLRSGSCDRGGGELLLYHNVVEKQGKWVFKEETKRVTPLYKTPPLPHEPAVMRMNSLL